MAGIHDDISLLFVLEFSYGLYMLFKWGTVHVVLVRDCTCCFSEGLYMLFKWGTLPQYTKEKTKYWTTLKSRGELKCPRRVSSSCSCSGTRRLTDVVCLYTYEFWLSLCKIVRYIYSPVNKSWKQRLFSNWFKVKTPSIYYRIVAR
jgi:hypothetical protein